MSDMATEGGMTFEQAKSALEGAGAQESADEAATAASFETPAETPDQQATEAGLGERADLGATEEASTEATDDSFMGGDFNPDLLPDELKPGFKQLQGAFTKRTQELAEQRKALEALGSQEELQQITEFYHSLQDPEYLASFYNELGGVVQELGLVEDPAAQGTQQQEATTPSVELPPELAGIIQSDPELAPVVERLTSLESTLHQLQQQTAQEREALNQERELMSQAAEIDRMVQVVREDNPTYGDEDWDAIYDRAVALDGDVLKAAELYRADTDRIIASYLEQKPVPQSVTPIEGAGTVTESDDEDRKPRTLDEGQKAAEAWLHANDISEFSG